MRGVSWSGDDGFTLVEALVACILLLGGLLGTFVLVTSANSAAFASRAREGATNISRQVIEAARGIPYSQLNSESIISQLQQRPDLSDGSRAAGGYQLQRRGILYTVTATACSIDDPADGIGPHDSGSWCSNSAGTAGTGAVLDYGAAGADGSVALGGGTPDDYKRISVTVSWSYRTSHTISATDVVANPGPSDGPAIVTLGASGLSSSTVTSSSIASIGFTVTTDRAPATLDWSVNGTVAGTATGSGTSWTFNWPIASLPDGTYLVSADAFDPNGVRGAERSLTITLNRSAPAQVQGVLAGRDGTAVDIEWTANPDLDLSGYRVYRSGSGGSGGTTVVCSLVTGTSCQDTSAPTGSPSYYVVALDRDPSGNLREGAASALATVPGTNNPPNAPTGLAASSSSGSTILAWNAPAVADPDAGDTIVEYRIYRDGAAYANRYDTTGSGSITTYTDTHTGGTTHTYYVTAVDPHLSESTPAGPVTR